MWIVVLCCGWVPGRLVIRYLRSCESERMTWSHTKSLCRVELIFLMGYVGSVRDVYDHVYVSSCYMEFVRKTLIRVFTCVELFFSKLAS
jgi:hypothetical protein